MRRMMLASTSVGTPLISRTTSFLLVALWLIGFCDAGSKTVVFMSDLHYDPYYGTGKAYQCSDQQQLVTSPFGQSGCDTPPRLLFSAVDDISKLQPEQVYVSGDWLRHNMDQLPSTDVNSVLGAVASSIAALQANVSTPVTATTPASVEWSIGNNDVIPDYSFDASKLRPLRAQSDVMYTYKLLSIAEKATFEDCGRYNRDLVESKLRVIVLNTLLWSTSIVPPIASTITDPCDQFMFLNRSLATVMASGWKAIIIGHIPPGLNFHATLVNGLSSNSAMYWRSDFQESFIEIVRDYQSVISFILFGHTHMFSFVADTSIGVPIFIVPSITPAFGNNPSYLIATLQDDTNQVLRIQQRIFSYATNSWVNGLEMSTSYGTFIDLTNLTSIRGLSLMLSGQTSTYNAVTVAAAQKVFLDLYTGGNPTSANIFTGGSCKDSCLRLLLCSTMYLRYDDLSSCANLHESIAERTVGAATIAFTVISTLIFAGGVGYLIYKRKELMSPPSIATECHETQRLKAHVEMQETPSALAAGSVGGVAVVLG